MRFRRKEKKQIKNLVVLVILLALAYIYTNTGVAYTIMSLTRKEITNILMIVIIIALSVIIGRAMYKKHLNHRKYLNYINNPIYVIDKQDGNVFEEQLAAYFKREGYKVEVVGKSHDYGCDLLATKNGITTAIQAKRYKSKVGIQAVQQIIGAKGYYGADKVMVCTNNYFTPSAINLAEANGVELWDRNELIKKLNKKP